MKVRFITWDWKEQIGIEELNEALQGVFNGKSVPCISEVNSGSDSYIVVVSSETVSTEEAQIIYDYYERFDGKESPFDKVVTVANECL